MIGSQSARKLPSLSLVLGGARSGKSRLAERLLTSSGRTRHYIATAQAWDDEMRARITAHQQDRGGDWITHEAPRDVAAVLANLPANHVVGDHSRPVDSIWSPSEITAASHNNLAALLEEIPDRKTEALAHYRRVRDEIRAFVEGLPGNVAGGKE